MEREGRGGGGRRRDGGGVGCGDWEGKSAGGRAEGSIVSSLALVLGTGTRLAHTPGSTFWGNQLHGLPICSPNSSSKNIRIHLNTFLTG
jgi:hypothetical protein